MTKPLQEIRDELASNILQEKIAMEPGEDMFTAMFKKGFDSALTELSKRAGEFPESEAVANSSGNNTFTTGARWMHQQLMPRVAALEAELAAQLERHQQGTIELMKLRNEERDALEKERAKLRAALERIAKIRTLPLTDSNDTDEELATQYSSVIDILVHISREALSGREEGGG